VRLHENEGCLGENHRFGRHGDQEKVFLTDRLSELSFPAMGFVEKGVSVMGKRCGFLFAFVSVLAMGCFASGSELGNIHFGHLYVHPRLGVEGTYDDNLFLLGEERVDDFLFSIKPGIDLDYTREGKSARVNYLADIGRYVDNSVYDYETHVVDAAVDLEFVSGLMVFVGDNFRTANDRPTYEWVPLIRRRQNTADLKVGYEFTDRLSVQGGYDRLMIDYREPLYEVYNRDEDIVNATVFYRMFPKVSLLGQVEYRWIDYDQNTGRRFDSEGIAGWLGITGQLTSKMVALIKGGWQTRDYDGPQEDWDGGVFSVDIVHRATETLFLTVGGTREAIESTYATNNYYVSTEARAGVEKALGPKISVAVSGFYANSNYPEVTLTQGTFSERDDDIWGARAGVRYNIQPWLSTSLWYTHEERNSNQDTFDYGDNRVSLGVWAVF